MRYGLWRRKGKEIQWEHRNNPPPTRFKRPQPSSSPRESRVKGEKRYASKKRAATIPGMLVSRLRIVNPGNSTALCIASPSHENNVASASKTVIRPVWSKHEYVSFPRQRDPRVQYFIDAPVMHFFGAMQGGLWQSGR